MRWWLNYNCGALNYKCVQHVALCTYIQICTYIHRPTTDFFLVLYIQICIHLGMISMQVAIYILAINNLNNYVPFLLVYKNQILHPSVIHQFQYLSVKVTWNLSRCWTTRGTTTSDQIWNGTVPATKDSNILQLSKIVQRELWMMSVWIFPLPYVTAFA